MSDPFLSVVTVRLLTGYLTGHAANAESFFGVTGMLFGSSVLFLCDALVV